jgi:hypothetical protein
MARAPTLPLSRAAARTRARRPEIKGRGRPTRSSAGRSSGWSRMPEMLRTHSDEQVVQIAASIREFGFTNPVLVDEEGTLIAGHGRVLGEPGRFE